MPELDLYKTLGVSREASADTIRKAYKKLARKYHPDAYPDDKQAAEKFKEIQQAYAVLGDSEKRDQYDRYGAAFQGGGRPPWPGGGAGAAGPIDLGELFGGRFDLGDLFGGAFGQGKSGGFPGAGPQAARAVQGNDLTMDSELPFQVAAEGGQHGLQIPRTTGRERLTVKIPPGVETGSVIRLSGQGEPGLSGGPAGDLLLTIKVAPHPYFRREGKNLLLDVPITPTEAALGAKVDVPTLVEGTVTVTIPAGTSGGTKLRLRGKGVPDQKTKSRGDQFVVVKIVVPQQLDDEARRLYAQLDKAAPQSPRADLW